MITFQTFENVVRASKSVLVSGTVNGFDLSELNYNLSPLRRIIDEQYERINRLRSLLASFTVANFANGRLGLKLGICLCRCSISQ